MRGYEVSAGSHRPSFRPLDLQLLLKQTVTRAPRPCHRAPDHLAPELTALTAPSGRSAAACTPGERGHQLHCPLGQPQTDTRPSVRPKGSGRGPSVHGLRTWTTSPGSKPPLNQPKHHQGTQAGRGGQEPPAEAEGQGQRQGHPLTLRQEQLRAEGPPAALNDCSQGGGGAGEVGPAPKGSSQGPSDPEARGSWPQSRDVPSQRHPTPRGSPQQSSGPGREATGMGLPATNRLKADTAQTGLLLREGARAAAGARMGEAAACLHPGSSALCFMLSLL